MALVFADLVRETTSTTGTGTLTLTGAVTNYQSFATIGNANTTYYRIISGADSEVGIGTYTLSGTTLSRDTVLYSSAGGTTKITVAVGATIICTYPAEKVVILDASGNATALGTPAAFVATNVTGLPISTGVSGLATGVATFLATPSSANLATALTDETGTGACVFATSPTLVTPALGTPSALVGTNITGTATAFTASNVTTNANLTGAVTSVGNASSLGSFTSLQLLTALTDETGTGANVFSTSPTLVTPLLGTPTSGTLTNCTFPTLNQNTTGSAATVTGDATGSTFGFNSGYGSVATAYGCRAWVNFNGTGTVAIRASGNVSSITDGGVGIYTVNFTTAMPDANYSALVNGESNPAAGNDSTTAQTYATSSVGLKCRGSGGGAHDPIYVTLGVFR